MSIQPTHEEFEKRYKQDGKEKLKKVMIRLKSDQIEEIKRIAREQNAPSWLVIWYAIERYVVIKSE